MVWVFRFSKLIIVLILILLVTSYALLRSSLPQLDGVLKTNSQHPATVTRDRNGIPTIYSQDRVGIAYALGFVHGQERFFQMDLLRRNSAGELSELFGQAALSFDTKVRTHQFRMRALSVLTKLPEDQRSILKEYSLGVNEGLRNLSVRPFEYLLLGSAPKPWKQEDSLLVLYSMYMDLQHEFGSRERLLGLLKNNLMPDVYDFLTPKGSRWDAAIDGTMYNESPLPKSTFEPVPVITPLSTASLDTKPLFDIFNNPHEALAGSNSWVVSGLHTESGSAMLANDMHLGLRMPNIWYRAAFRYQSEKGETVRIDGVTLPGTPAMVVGSNRDLAWGFTNSYGDWSDIIVLKTSDDESSYLTPEGFRKFTTDTEVVRIKGGESKFVEIHQTIWGPVIGKNEQNEALVLRWVAHDVEGVNFNLLDLEQARSVNDGMSIAHTMGIPAQNIVLADKNGDIAWTIAGPVPNRISSNRRPDWQTPQDWSQGEYEWSGYLSSENIPKVRNPQQGKIWTGNSRVVGGRNLDRIGNGGYALGARSQQIRDLLFAEDTFNEEIMLKIATNHEARFLSRWQALLVDEIMTETFVQEHNLTQAQQHIINWEGKASTTSIGYTLVQQFRHDLRKELFTHLLFDLSKLVNEPINIRVIRHQLEVPLWLLVEQKPEHLLPEGFANWTQYLQTRFFKTIKDLTLKYDGLEMARWGNVNKTQIQHPLSKAVPAMSFLLDMPSQEVSGDSYMPNVQGPAFGASERFIVAPGHEDSAILHMPTGQSSHPMSPYFGRGHHAWVNGLAEPLLPGNTVYKIELSPRNE